MRRYNIVPWKQLKDQSLSEDGLKRLSWIDWYYSHERNAEATCRHFGISKSVFYRWFNRFNRNNLKTLEFDAKTRKPKHVRRPNIDPCILQRIYDIRIKLNNSPFLILHNQEMEMVGHEGVN